MNLVENHATRPGDLPTSHPASQDGDEGDEVRFPWILTTDGFETTTETMEEEGDRWVGGWMMIEGSIELEGG